MHVIVSQLSHSTPKPHLSPNYPDLALFDFKCLAVDLTRSCVNHKNTRENCSEQSVESNLKEKKKKEKQQLHITHYRGAQENSRTLMTTPLINTYTLPGPKA